MSKLTIFLCVVLVASAVNASLVIDALTFTEQKVEGLIAATINATKQAFDDIKSKVAEQAAKLEAEAKSIVEKLNEQVTSTLDKVQAEIDKLTGKANGVDVTDCNKLAAQLENTGLAVITNMTACVDNKLATGNGYIQNIITLSQNVLANLTAIREEARHCSDNVDGIKGAAVAIICNNVAAAKAAWVETKAVPSLTIEMTKISYLLGTLQPSLAYCTATNGLITFFHESSTIVERSKECIQQKIDEARPSTEKATTQKA